MLAVLSVSEPQVRLAADGRADLVRTVEPAPGVRVSVDLARPEHWWAVEVDRWADADPVLLTTLLGAEAVRRVGDVLGTDAEMELEVTPAPAWRRLAVIDALDWWLQLPLDQALLDAERAVVRARAARALPLGPLRQHLVGRALTLARRSAGEFTVYLTGLTDGSLPRALFSGLSRLADGYGVLARSVDGVDNELDGVLTAWDEVQALVPVVGRFELRDQSVQLTDSSDSLVDPRQLRARIVQGVRMVPTGSAVRVLVPAFGAVASAVSDRLMVRLVDRRSGAAQDPVLLTLRSGADAEQVGARTPVFTEVVPLRGTPLEHLRADVFDADSSTDPATDSTLLRQRRAQYVLGEWRRAVAESRLSRSILTRNRRLARLVDVPSEEPLFYGGPSTADVKRLIDGSGSHAWFRSTTGAGEPLVAELAAVHDAAAAS
ncbi:hypothetical protein AB0E69_14690 [Kribbella sp. NPDC026611]|uniref:hypothetical protein n=1 Tax=Kribbella sp. NPDC026611 TaxID=3154911 RepID=UPI0033EBAB75